MERADLDHDMLAWHTHDWADTAVNALSAIRRGHTLTEADIHGSLAHIRQLQKMLTALTDELVLIAREPGDDGEPLVSWRELGAILDQHFSTIRERHQRVAEGQPHPYRAQIIANTSREGTYPATEES